MHLTVGGDKLDCPDATASPAVSLLKTKLLINSVISDYKLHNAKFCSMYLKDFFLRTSMERLEYIRIHSKYFSDDFKKEYNFQDKIHTNGYIYCSIKKGIYGLKQAAILVYKLLVKRLERRGYVPIPLTN